MKQITKKNLLHDARRENREIVMTRRVHILTKEEQAEQERLRDLNIGPWSTQEEIDAKNAYIESKGQSDPSGADVAGNTFWFLVYGGFILAVTWDIWF